MENNLDRDRHYVGSFNIEGHQIQGEIIHNIQSGMILLVVRFEFEINPSKKTSVIIGKLNNGTVVNLYNCSLIKKHIQMFQYKELHYSIKYMIWSYEEFEKPQFNLLTCEIENGLNWSNLAEINTEEPTSIFIKSNTPKIFYWYNAKITFYTKFENELLKRPRNEVCKVIEHLLISIETSEKHDVDFFIDIRDKIISMISFAIKDNINFIEQLFSEYDDCENVGKDINYTNYLFIDNVPKYNIYKTHCFDYNFYLNNLVGDDPDLSGNLERLAPIFNLYLSLFKYPYMPIEMIFLNIVQALETFHSRFFYKNDKKEYIQSVKERFSEGTLEYKLLLSDTQMDTHCGYIILVSRLNDLLIRGENNLFSRFYYDDEEFAQKIADTRHYYTHYGESKETKALKGEDLENSIHILSLLLEYNVCKILGINASHRVAENLRLFNLDKSDLNS